MLCFACSNLAAGRHKKTHKKHKRKQQKVTAVTTSDSEDSCIVTQEREAGEIISNDKGEGHAPSLSESSDVRASTSQQEQPPQKVLS